MEHIKRWMPIVRLTYVGHSTAVGFYAYKGKHTLFYERVEAGDYCKIA